MKTINNLLSIAGFVLVLSVLLYPSTGFAKKPVYGERTLLTCDSSQAVYELRDDGKIRAFLTEDIFYSYYKNFDALKIISCDELDTYEIDVPISYSKYSYLFKHESRPEVYVTDLFIKDKYGRLVMHLEDEETAKKHFGYNWSKSVSHISEEKWNREMYNIFVSTKHVSALLFVKTKSSSDVFVLNGETGDTVLLEDESEAEELVGNNWNQYVLEIDDEYLDGLTSRIVPTETAVEQNTNTQTNTEETTITVEPFRPASRQVTGKVTDATTGLPIPGVTAVVSHSSISDVTDENGEFTLRYPTGTSAREVYIATNSWYKKSKTERVSAGDAVAFELSASRTDRNYELQYPTTEYLSSSLGRTQLSGYVYDMSTGEPIRNAAVVSSHSSGGGTTNLEGYFLDDSVPRGPHRLYVITRDAQSKTTLHKVYYQVNVADHMTTEVILNVDMSN